MKKIMNNLKRICYDNNKFTLLTYSFFEIVTFIFLLNGIFKKEFIDIILCTITIFIFNFLFYIEIKANITIPNYLKIIIFINIFATQILGEVLYFYQIIPHWDTFLHGLNGFISACVGFSLITLLNSNIKLLKLNLIFIIMFTFSFSNTIGVCWEIVEYSFDNILNIDSQNDRYINEINTIIIDPKKEGNIISINDIGYTIILDKNNNQLIKLDGYLDIGLYDTMKDLIANLLGVIIFCILEYLYVKNTKKYSFINNFIIKKGWFKNGENNYY